MAPGRLREIVAMADAPYAHRSGDVGLGDLATIISFRTIAIRELLDLLRECRTVVMDLSDMTVHQPTGTYDLLDRLEELGDP